MDAKLVAVLKMDGNEHEKKGMFAALEVDISRVHAEESILRVDKMNIDADKWNL